MIGSGTSIFETKPFAELTRLAEKPFNLTLPDSLRKGDRLKRYVCRGTHYSLYYGTQRVTDQVLDELQAVADELALVDQFLAMKQGEVCNRIEGVESENRSALHTACRDLFRDNPDAPEQTRLAKNELESLELFLGQLENREHLSTCGKPFDTLVHIGIGGSDLGPRCVYEALKPFCLPNRSVHFISNVDPDDAARVLSQVNLETSLVSIVSKSGTTLETLTNEAIVREALVNAGCDPAKHCIAVTGKGSPMDDPSHYLKSFYIWDWVGGRYSSCSMVGAVMLGFAFGMGALLEFLKGAATSDLEGEERDIRKNVPLLMALLGIWNHNFLGMPTQAILPYSQGLHRFSAHIQQLDMESNGKAVRRNGQKVVGDSGPIIWGEPGTNGQHAFYQLLHQGTGYVPVEFIGFLESQMGKDLKVQQTTSHQKLVANLLAQQVALATGRFSSNPNRFFAGNRPSSLLLGKQLSFETMGALLGLYEAKIVYQGFAWDVNSFDQEGVQLGKVLAGRFLQAMKGEKLDTEAIEAEYLALILQ